jgi:hypothetical protein
MIKSLIQSYLAPYETFIWAGLAVLMAVGFAVFVHHERVVGEQKVIAADAAAVAREHAKSILEQQAIQAKADAAEKVRDATQKTLDDYMSAHPVGSVFVCNKPHDSGPTGLPEVSSSNPGDAVSGAGPDPVSAVPSGVDIGPDLSTLVRAAGTVATLYRQYQQQPEVK